MISRLEIKGFKSLVDVSIELGAVNVFIGANGSGKSNLLEAVGLLSAIGSGSLEGESIHYRGVRPGRPESFTSSFLGCPKRMISMTVSDGETSYAVDFEPDGGQSSKWAIRGETVAFKDTEVLKRSSKGVEILIGSQFDDMAIGNRMSSSSVTPFLRLYFAFNKSNFQPDDTNPDIPYPSYDFFEDLKQYAIFSPSTPQLRSFEEDNSRTPLGRGGEGLSRALIEMLDIEENTLGPFDLDDVYDLIDWSDSLRTELELATSSVGHVGAPIRLRIDDRFRGETHKSVSLLESSEGALYVLFILGLVGHEQSPKLFAVDNFDHALHPRLALALTRLISDQILADGTRQMLATTHNPLVLDGLDLLDDRVRLFTVDRDAKGASLVQRVLVTEELIEKGFSLSRLWTSGRLGGVPSNL